MELEKKKAEILQNWQKGDDSAAARIVGRLIGQSVSREALRQWREGGRSKLTPVYIEAHRRVQQYRRKKSNQAARQAAG